MSSSYEDRIADLEKLIHELRAAKAVETESIRAATPIKWRYELQLVTDYKHDRILDESVKMYRLMGTVQNLDEARAAGHSDRDLQAGGLNYLYNTFSGKIIMSHGGGRAFIGFLSGNVSEASKLAVEELNEFIARFPNGGDVTEIVERYRQRVS